MIAILLFRRWVRRDWSGIERKKCILHANIKVRSERRERQRTPTTASTTKEPLTNRERVFIHWEYHPCDIPKHIVRGLYNLHLKNDLEKWLDISKLPSATPDQKTTKTT